MDSTHKPWALSWRDFLSDLPFFGGLGLICGVIQWVGYYYFNKSSFGVELMQEHIAFQSLMLVVIVLWGLKTLTEVLERRRGCSMLRALTDRVASRAVGFASVAGCVVAGFAGAAALFGNVGHAIMFLYFDLYFLALAEVAANPVIKAGHSRAFWPALGVLIGMPFALR